MQVYTQETNLGETLQPKLGVEKTVIWCFWLGSRKGIRPVKNFEW